MLRIIFFLNYIQVNMKAIDIHVKLVEDRKKFVKRLQDCKEGEEVSSNLCQMLEEKKHEKIDFTFNQVAKYFAEIFQILVPNGRGKLVFDRKPESQVFFFKPAILTSIF